MKYKNIKILRLKKIDLIDDIIENITFKDSVNVVFFQNISKVVGKATNIRIKYRCLMADLDIADKQSKLIKNGSITTASIVFIPIKFETKNNIRIIKEAELIAIDLSNHQCQIELNGNLLTNLN